jgi:hypothetical protein
LDGRIAGYRFSAMRIGKRAVPIGWTLLVFEALLVARRHWGNLKPRSRARVGELAAKSKGNPTKLTAHERRELVRIAREVDLRTLARDLGEVVSPVRLPGKRRRRR